MRDPECPIARAVMEDIATRADAGMAKYGITLARADINLRGWLRNAYEELLDAACYIKRAMDEMDVKGH